MFTKKPKQSANAQAAPQGPSSSPSAPVSQNQILQLQSTVGNQAVLSMLQMKMQPPIQRSLRKWEDIKKKGKNLNWTPHKTKISSSNKAVGLGANVQNGKSLTTKIKYQDDAEEMGKGVEANPLGPDHPIGDSPSGRPQEITDDYKYYVGDSNEYIAGHLLNHHLGGPGNDVRNLTPMPRSFNSKFAAEVEHVVKTLVNDNRGWISYKVDVDYQDDEVEIEEEVKSKSKKNKKKQTELVTYEYQYASHLDAEWFQLDEDGKEISGTKGTWSSDIPAPSAIAGNRKINRYPGLDKKGNQSTVRDGTAAVTEVDFEEVILDAPEVLRKQWALKIEAIKLVRALKEKQDQRGQQVIDQINLIAKAIASADEDKAMAYMDDLLFDLEEAIGRYEEQELNDSIDSIKNKLSDLHTTVSKLGDFVDQKMQGIRNITNGLSKIADEYGINDAFEEVVERLSEEYTDKINSYREAIDRVSWLWEDTLQRVRSSLLSDMPGTPLARYEYANENYDMQGFDDDDRQQMLRVEAFNSGKMVSLTPTGKAGILAEYRTSRYNWVELDCSGQEAKLHQLMIRLNGLDKETIETTLEGWTRNYPEVVLSYFEKVEEALREEELKKAQQQNKTTTSSSEDSTDHKKKKRKRNSKSDSNNSSPTQSQSQNDTMMWTPNSNSGPFSNFFDQKN